MILCGSSHTTAETSAHLLAVVGAPRSRASQCSAPSLRARRATIALTALCGSLAVFAVLASSAFAARSYLGQLTGFNEPSAVAVDPSDNVWVADPGNAGLITEFNPSGIPISHQSGSGVFSPCGTNLAEESMAIDVVGNLFVASGPECGFNQVVRFDPAGAEEYRFRLSSPHQAISSKVENLALYEPGSDHLAITQINPPLYPFETQPQPGVEIFEILGNPVYFSAEAPYIAQNEVTGTPSGPFGSVGPVAFDSAGDLYVVDPAKEAIDEFKPTGEFVREITGAGVPGGLSSRLTGLAVDPTTGTLLLADSGNNVIDEFAPTGDYLSQITGTSPSHAFGKLVGEIAVNSAGDLYVADGLAGVVDIFGSSSTSPPIPQVTNTSSTTPRSDVVDLTAEVDPNGSGLTSCYFEYGLHRPLEHSTPCEPSAGSIPVDSSDHLVSATIGGLIANTEYHYRLVAANASGTAYGPYGSLTTPQPEAPIVGSSSASAVGSTSAMLNAEIDPNFATTIVAFEYGPTNSYGTRTAFTTLGSSDGLDHEASGQLIGLEPAKTYHYRVIALNFAGPSAGPDETFVTLGPPTLGQISVSDVTQTGAQIEAEVNPNRSPTSYHVDYGLTGEYEASSESAAIGTDGIDHKVDVSLTGLKPGVTYHLRFVASNSVAVVSTTDQTFETLAALATSKPGGGTTKCKRHYVLRHDRCVLKSKGHPHHKRAAEHRRASRRWKR